MTYLIISAEEQNTNTSVMLIALSCAKGDKQKQFSHNGYQGCLFGRSTSN